MRRGRRIANHSGVLGRDKKASKPLELIISKLYQNMLVKEGGERDFRALKVEALRGERGSSRKGVAAEVEGRGGRRHDQQRQKRYK